MAYASSLAEGHIKVAVLTAAPANPAAPTTTELNAGIDASPLILESDFVFGNTDSDKVQEKSLADVNNRNTVAASNLQAAMTIFRKFNTSTGVADPTGDALFTACKTKGTTLWMYARNTGKLATAAWASGDEIRGMSVLTDDPQDPTAGGGFIKKHIPLEPQIDLTSSGLGAVA